MYSITFDVTGSHSFPVDMLRYDACFPANTKDGIEISMHCQWREEEYAQGTVITLCSLRANKWTPTEARWKSFGWTVVTKSIRAVRI